MWFSFSPAVPFRPISNQNPNRVTNIRIHAIVSFILFEVSTWIEYRIGSSSLRSVFFSEFVAIDFSFRFQLLNDCVDLNFRLSCLAIIIWKGECIWLEFDGSCRPQEMGVVWILVLCSLDRDLREGLCSRQIREGDSREVLRDYVEFVLAGVQWWKLSQNVRSCPWERVFREWPAWRFYIFTFTISIMFIYLLFLALLFNYTFVF